MVNNIVCVFCVGGEAVEMDLIAIMKAVAHA